MGAPKGGAPKGGGPKISRFFSSPTGKFVLFFPLCGCLFVEFWWCLKRRGAQMCTFGVLGLSCASPGGPVWWGRQGFTLQPKSPNVHILGFRPSKTTKIQREDPQRGKKRTNFPAGEGQKRAKFGRSGGRSWGRAVLGKGGPGEGRSWASLGGGGGGGLRWVSGGSVGLRGVSGFREPSPFQPPLFQTPSSPFIFTEKKKKTKKEKNPWV